jgi:hypothetical protein
MALRFQACVPGYLGGGGAVDHASPIADLHLPASSTQYGPLDVAVRKPPNCPMLSYARHALATLTRCVQGLLFFVLRGQVKGDDGKQQ